jgi:hypothetical protein
MTALDDAWDETASLGAKPYEHLTSHDLGFRARALAQAHALTESALAYRRWRIGRDQPNHPIPELSTWAATAFLTGYCVRCVEESWPTAKPRVPLAGSDSGLEDWDSRASRFANALTANPDATLVEHQTVLDALDNVIGREIEKRAEHVKEQMGSADWEQFEHFIGWWVLHGYAIRAVES